MDLHIRKRSATRATYIIVVNLLLTVGIFVFAVFFGDFHEQVSISDILFEGASVVVAFALFVAAALVRVSAARMVMLLSGLFLFQIGRLLDVLDEVLYMALSYWTVLGDALMFGGEVMLAVVAFDFVKVTTEIASTDRLTGLYNRAFHVRRLQLYLNKVPQQEGNVAVIAIDLDKFKLINDKFGHGFGDEVLRHTADLLITYVKDKTGIVSRTGGEEFEFALYDVSEKIALAVAEEIRSLLERTPPEGVDVITASIGVALNQANEDATSLRKRADAAAYMAKQSGRNRVSLAGKNQTISIVHEADPAQKSS